MSNTLILCSLRTARLGQKGALQVVARSLLHTVHTKESEWEDFEKGAQGADT